MPTISLQTMQTQAMINLGITEKQHLVRRILPGTARDLSLKVIYGIANGFIKNNHNLLEIFTSGKVNQHDEDEEEENVFNDDNEDDNEDDDEEDDSNSNIDDEQINTQKGSINKSKNKIHYGLAYDSFYTITYSNTKLTFYIQKDSSDPLKYNYGDYEYFFNLNIFISSKNLSYEKIEVILTSFYTKCNDIYEKHYLKISKDKTKLAKYTSIEGKYWSKSTIRKRDESTLYIPSDVLESINGTIENYKRKKPYSISWVKNINSI